MLRLRKNRKVFEVETIDTLSYGLARKKHIEIKFRVEKQ